MPETGHAKNVANFFRLITFCQSYGARYNPVNRALHLNALLTIHTDAATAVSDHHQQRADYKNAINLRQTQFKNVLNLPIRMVAVLQSNFADDKTLTDARHFVKKMRGERIIKLPKLKKATKEEEEDENETPATNTPPPANNTTPANTTDTEDETAEKPKRRNSVSQRSYDQQINHFSQFVALLQNNSSYQTNEPDLQINTLQTNLINLQTINQNAITAETNISATLYKRNKILYQDPNSMFQLAQAVKNYIKSVFGQQSIEYKNLIPLKFIQPKN